MFMRAKRRVFLRLMAFAAGVYALPAWAEDVGPRTGEYKIVQVALTTGSVTGAIVLKADGTYELYDMPARSFRSRGNYRYDAAQNRVVWLSGVNHEMGRGGTFSVEQSGRVHRIAMGPRVYAINGD